jgi:glycosyltransferase involved in cell wall biosynthesis
MNMLIGTNTLVEGSGIDRVVMMQVRGLQAQGHTVRVVCFQSTPSFSRSVEVVELPHARSVSLERLRRLSPFWRPSTRRQLRQLLAWCDVFYAEQYPWSVVGVWAKRQGKRFIQINHGVATPGTFRHWSHQVYVGWINKLALKYGQQANEVWSVSQTLADEWEAATGQKSKVYRPVSDWVQTIPARTPEQARTELGQGQPYLLAVGRISPHKGLHKLIEVMQLLKTTHPNVELKLVGKVADQGYLEQLKQDAPPSVTFVGEVSDQQLGLWYQGAAAVVTGAQWEGWNLPIAEALHFKRPVVAFDLPVHKEFTDPLVHLVPLNQIDLFADTCRQLLP